MYYYTGYIIGALVGFTTNTSLKREIGQFFNRSFPNELLDLSDIAEAVVRDIVSPERYFQEASNLGINEERARVYLDLRKALLPVENLIDAYFKNKINENELVSRASKLGIAEKDVFLIKDLKEKRLPPEVVINAWFRGIDKAYWRGDIFNELRDEGWTDDRIKIIQEVSKYFPSPSDLIRFAVREAYTPEVVEKFRLDEDLPEKFLEEAKKIGMDEETAKLYWRAHWELPSITAGFEMFQRGIISYDELVLLLRTQDVMPFWRDKLIKLSYSPITRTDVRRMHALGVLNYDEMVKAYQDLGYSPENAKRLADFTVEYNKLHPLIEDTEADEHRRKEKDLTASQILKAYRENLVSRDYALRYLQSITYSEDEANFLVSLVDVEKEEDDIYLILDILEFEYLEGIKTYEEVQAEIKELNLPYLKEEKFLNDLILKKRRSQKKPSKTDLENFLKKKIITESEFREEMELLGYSDKYINWYLKSYKK